MKMSTVYLLGFMIFCFVATGIGCGDGSGKEAAEQKTERKVYEVIPSNLIDAEPLNTIYRDHEVNHVCFSPDARYLAIGCDDGTARVYELKTWKQIAKLKRGSNVSIVLFSPDSRYFAMASGNTLRVFEVDGWKQIFKWQERRWGITSMAFSPDSRYLAVGDGYAYGADYLYVFKVGSWKKLTKIQHSNNWVKSIEFSPDGRYLALWDDASNSYYDFVCVFEVGSWKLVGKFEYAYSFDFSPDSRNIIICREKEANLFEIKNWNVLKTCKAKERWEKFYSVDFSPNGHYIAIGGSRAFVLKFESWETIAELGRESSAYFSSDGHYVVTRSKKSTSFYGTENFRLIKELGYWASYIGTRLVGYIDDNKKEKLFALDMSNAGLFFLMRELRKLGFEKQVSTLELHSMEIDSDFRNKLKIIEAERKNELTKLGSKEKGEFETEKEYSKRITKRDVRIAGIEKSFGNKRLSLRRERNKKNIRLLEQYEKELDCLLIASRNPVDNLKLSIESYSAETQMFPISVSTSGVETFKGTVRVPRTNARNFKNNISNLQVSGEVQLTRAGNKRLVSIVIHNPDIGSTYYATITTPVTTKKASPVPPNLTANISFVEPSGDRALNAEEKGEIIVKIMNTGKGSAYNVISRLVPSEAIDDLRYEPEKTIPEISPGSTHKVVFPLIAGIDLPEKNVQVKVEFEEKNGLPPNPLKIKFKTRSVVPPNIQVVDYVIDDASKDGTIQQEEVVKMTIRTQNRGQGIAKNVRAKVSLGNNVFQALNVPLEHRLGQMAPDDLKEFTVAFYTNQKVRDKLPINIHILEERHRFNTEKSLALKLNAKEKTVFETVVDAKELKVVKITDLESPSDIEQNIPKTGLINKAGVAVVIGNYDYRNAPKVLYARRDAIVMKEYLTKILGFDPANIISLTDATLADMVNVFGKLGGAKKSKLSYYLRKDADIFIYYTGHGAPGLRDKKGYLVPIDADPNNIETTGYSLDMLYENLNKLDASNILVVIDACFSGNSQGGVLFSHASPMFVEAQTGHLQGGTVITSSQGDQISSWYPEKKHSLFTYFFLKGIKEKAVKRNNVVLKELENYVTEHVDRIAKRLYGRIQTPLFEGNKEEELFNFK